jgi:hypothetical protein
MDNYFKEAEAVINELYGKDMPMTLATVNGDKPNVRVIDAYYKENAFYITSYALSNKMKEISKNPNVALGHNLFVAHGVGINLGHPLDEPNASLREELMRVFFAFYDRHVDENDKHTCILKVVLNDALVFAHDYKYIIDFQHRTASREDHINDIPV